MKYKHVILGGTGHVGSAITNALIAQHEPVMLIGHDKQQAADWIKKGAAYEVADILDSNRLHDLFSQGERLFILNPPALPSTDTVVEETKNIHSILAALEGVYLEKIVAASTYGAQPGKDIGDLGVLYQLEQGLAKMQTPLAIIRSAYYMSNWDMAIATVEKDGIVPTLYPADFKLPMVAPEDVGHFAATFMLNTSTGIHFIEAPQHYSPNEVAEAFSHTFNKPVKVATTPEGQWQESLKKTGFSERSATYMCNMTKLTLQNNFDVVNPHKGQTSLQKYIASVVTAKQNS